MASTFKTENLKLSQFQADDKPAWLTDYNNDMEKIDSHIGGLNAEVVKAAQNANKATAKVAKGTLEIVSLYPRETEDYTVEFDMPEGYEGGPVAVDGVQTQLYNQSGETAVLDVAVGSPTVLRRRGDKVYLPSNPYKEPNYVWKSAYTGAVNAGNITFNYDVSPLASFELGITLTNGLMLSVNHLPGSSYIFAHFTTVGDGALTGAYVALLRQSTYVWKILYCYTMPIYSGGGNGAITQTSISSISYRTKE